jgi:hypothetical protein
MKQLTTRQLNQLTIALAGLTVLSCLCSVITFFNPNIFFNFLEPSRVAPHVLPTITPSPIRYPTLPPEWTSTPSPAATAARATQTHIPAPSDTPTPTATGKPGTPKPGASATKTRTPTATAKK